METKIFENLKKKSKKNDKGILNSLIVPKYLKGETLWAFWHFSLLQNIKKNLKVGPFEGKKSKKSFTVAKKIERGPFSLVRFRKCSKKG